MNNPVAIQNLLLPLGVQHEGEEGDGGEDEADAGEDGQPPVGEVTVLLPVHHLAPASENEIESFITLGC